jgi:hypothetical protein
MVVLKLYKKYWFLIRASECPALLLDPTAVVEIVRIQLLQHELVPRPLLPVWSGRGLC